MQDVYKAEKENSYNIKITKHAIRIKRSLKVFTHQILCVDEY